MEVAAGAMRPLLQKLGELLVGELTLERRVREDVLSVQREMAFMHAALRKVAEVPLDQLDEGVANWAREVRELSYDMEDAVDAFMVRAKADPEPARGGLKSQVQEFLKKTARLFGKGKALRQIDGAIREAQSRAKQLSELRQRYETHGLQDGGASGSSSGGASIDPRLMAMFSEATELVGVDSARDELIKMLSNRPKQHRKIISVVGFGGLGKTTLAKAVYDRIKVKFDCGAFVSVSQNPDITKVLRKMLYKLNKEESVSRETDESVRDAEQLFHDLNKFLENKRYLVVIDDIWDEKTWKIIKCALPENELGSRVITTSRILSVSEACSSSSDDKVYKMKPLSDADSQRLFYTRIFKRGDGCPIELEQVSRDILKKCGGVPLAIISIASLLSTQAKTRNRWDVVLQSIGHGLTDGGNAEDMQRILSFSYYDLPSHLKTCLLYLSIFPEDYEIRRVRLIWRWIAEGFIHNEGSDNKLFELGGKYFNELINRSMIQPTDIDLDGSAHACRVHDMVLDLIRSISRQENFITVWDGTEQGASVVPSNVVRRLSLQETTTSSRTTTYFSKVRSFTVFNTAVDSTMPSLSGFRVLRVLDLEDCDLRKCGGHILKLSHVSDLYHLRYLGLRRARIGELPEEIGKLQFLQTLDIRGFRGVLPLAIVGLKQLMFLRLDWQTMLPKQQWNLESLEELTGLRVGRDSAEVVRELGRLVRLRVLKVRWEEMGPRLGEALVQSLGNLHKIERIEVYAHGGIGDLMRGWTPPRSLRGFLSVGPTSALSRLPEWLSDMFLPLASLDIRVDQVRHGDLETLGKLPALRGLRLRAAGPIEDDDGQQAQRLSVRDGAFPSARACTFLHFVTAPSMFQRGSMPMVQRLQFGFRVWDVVGHGHGGRLGLDDLRMGHLPSLEEVHVELWYRKDDDLQEVERVAEALRREADVHPNHLIVRIDKTRVKPSGLCARCAACACWRSAA